MSHYIANLRDIEFCLFDLLGRDKVMGSAPYGEVDRDTAMGDVVSIAKFLPQILLEVPTQLYPVKLVKLPQRPLAKGLKPR